LAYKAEDAPDWKTGSVLSVIELGGSYVTMLRTPYRF
jgi:hypothetical protein